MFVDFPTEEGYMPAPRPILEKSNGDWKYHSSSVFPNEIQNGEWKNLIKITSSNSASKQRKFSWRIDGNNLNLNLKDC